LVLFVCEIGTMFVARLLINAGGLLFIVGSTQLFAEPPAATYLFPAGGQRGTSVIARVGGCNLHAAPRMIWFGTGVTAPTTLSPIPTLWFEGPVIPQPASQQKEDYRRDFSAELSIAPTAPLGLQTWRLAVSQGVTSPWGFVVGEFPEIVEDEVEGPSPTVRVELPVTINGRIFPREDVDVWSFVARAGQTITCQVVTTVFGSPLDARLEVRDPAGHVLGEQLPQGSTTPPLRFTAPVDGEYQIRIHDIAFGGLQDHVYRLTVTTGPCLDAVYPLGGRRGTQTRFELIGAQLPQTEVEIALPNTGSEFVWRLNDTKTSWGDMQLDLDDFDELREVEPNDMAPPACTLPCVLNGRIQQPGDVDLWRFSAKKGVEYQFEARAARLGSTLDAVLEVADADGKRLGEADDPSNGQTDALLRFIAPADAELRLIVRDRLPSRGDARFAYRIRATTAEQPEFALSLAVNAIPLERGKTGSVKLTLDRGPGFTNAVSIDVEGLPPGVSLAAPATIAANQKEITLQIKAETEARVTTVPLTFVGRAKVDEHELVRTAKVVEVASAAGTTSYPVASDACWLAVVPPTPFKFVGSFETKFIPRGAVFVRKYRVERNGFDGPLEVQLADRQGRHLQGVTAAPIVVPAGQSEFEFAVVLPPWMEIGRTCRSTLSVSGDVTDPDGSRHTVSYSSNDQNNQMIALVDPGRLAIQLARPTVAVTTGQRLALPVRLQRDRGLTNAAQVTLVSPKGCRGVTAAPLKLAGDQNEGSLVVEFDLTASGFDGRPITIRATTRDERGQPVTAETPLILVPVQ